ncbi:hypothetical protein, partial [Photobacterium phosphoreum]|uniref:hypothetical protein n=1 Tax=Photobacterium phosphoreum TaxID=659 RepID=UPI000D4ECF35
NNLSNYNEKLVSEYNDLLIKAKEKVTIEKETIQYSIKIAQAAKIIEPLAGISNENDIFNINLGVLGLKEKLKIFSSEKILPIIEPKLINLKKENEKLNQILVSHETDIISNPYIIKISKVQSLQNKDKSFIVMISLVFGVIFGSALIVIVDFIKNFNK